MAVVNDVIWKHILPIHLIPTLNYYPTPIHSLSLILLPLSLVPHTHLITHLLSTLPYPRHTHSTLSLSPHPPIHPLRTYYLALHTLTPNNLFPRTSFLPKLYLPTLLFPKLSHKLITPHILSLFTQHTLSPHTQFPYPLS